MSDTERAIERFKRDARFRMMAHSCAAAVMDDYREDDREFRASDAHDIALRAAIYTLERVVTADAELNAMRIERDHYKQLAEQALRYTLPPTLIYQPSPESTPSHPHTDPPSTASP